MVCLDPILGPIRRKTPSRRVASVDRRRPKTVIGSATHDVERRSVPHVRWSCVTEVMVVIGGRLSTDPTRTSSRPTPSQGVTTHPSTPQHVALRGLGRLRRSARHWFTTHLDARRTSLTTQNAPRRPVSWVISDIFRAAAHNATAPDRRCLFPLPRDAAHDFRTGRRNPIRYGMCVPSREGG